MKVFFSVGEPSGDLHGANLIRELKKQRPGIQCVGYGGPKMAAAGCELHEDLTELAVMWIWRVLLNIHKFLSLLRRADRFFAENSVDAVILIDYPGFNWWVARAAKKHGIEVFYYGAPQIWAWLSHRVRKMRRLVDHVLCKLPFEARWYRQHGCNATYVGHPYFDEMQQRRLDEKFLAEDESDPRPLVAILPGSRTQEVVGSLPCFLRAAKEIRRRVPATRFAIAAFKEKQARLARDLAAQAGLDVDVFVGKAAELIHLSRCCMACSGSVSLELLYHQKPTVIYYRVGRLFYMAAKYVLIKVRFITLVNLLAVEDPFDLAAGPYDPQEPDADRIPFPEYPSHLDRSQQIAAHLCDWLTDEELLQQRVEQLAALREQLGHSGASQTAATYIVTALQKKSASAALKAAA